VIRKRSGEDGGVGRQRHRPRIEKARRQSQRTRSSRPRERESTGCCTTRVRPVETRRARKAFVADCRACLLDSGRAAACPTATSSPPIVSRSPLPHRRSPPRRPPRLDREAGREQLERPRQKEKVRVGRMTSSDSTEQRGGAPRVALLIDVIPSVCSAIGLATETEERGAMRNTSLRRVDRRVDLAKRFEYAAPESWKFRRSPYRSCAHATTLGGARRVRRLRRSDLSELPPPVVRTYARACRLERSGDCLRFDRWTCAELRPRLGDAIAPAENQRRRRDRASGGRRSPS